MTTLQVGAIASALLMRECLRASGRREIRPRRNCRSRSGSGQAPLLRAGFFDPKRKRAAPNRHGKLGGPSQRWISGINHALRYKLAGRKSYCGTSKKRRGCRCGGPAGCLGRADSAQSERGWAEDQWTHAWHDHEGRREGTSAAVLVARHFRRARVRGPIGLASFVPDPIRTKVG